MKKALLLFLALGLLLAAVPAGAAGKLSVDQENFYVIDSYSVYSYGFAKISNVGDKPIKVNNALLEIMDKDGNPITSTDYFNGYAKFLEPGEYTYLRMYETIKDRPATDVTDYSLTVTGKSDVNYYNLRLPVVCEYKEKVSEGYSSNDFMFVTVTNNTEETLFDIVVVMALLDAEGQILFMADSYMYKDKGLTAGSSLVLKERIDSTFVEYFAKNNLVPAKVDAIAFVEVRK